MIKSFHFVRTHEATTATLRELCFQYDVHVSSRRLKTMTHQELLEFATACNINWVVRSQVDVWGFSRHACVDVSGYQVHCFEYHGDMDGCYDKVVKGGAVLLQRPGASVFRRLNVRAYTRPNMTRALNEFLETVLCRSI